LWQAPGNLTILSFLIRAKYGFLFMQIGVDKEVVATEVRRLPLNQNL